MPIANWNETQSDRDYNVYFFSYTSVFELEDERLPQYIKLETALGSYAFPTQSVEIHNYIGDYLENHNRKDLAEQFFLDRFSIVGQQILVTTNSTLLYLKKLKTAAESRLKITLLSLLRHLIIIMSETDY